MLAGVLGYVALIALVAATILSAGLAMTRMTIERAIQPYIASGLQTATASLQQTIASDMQNGGVPSPAPSFTPIPAACADAACTYKTAETITLTQSPPASPARECDATQTNCAPNVQTNPYVAEGRVTALVTVVVTGPGGAAVASRSASVVLRTFAVPPYAAIAGSREGTFDDVLGSASTGDDGGAPPPTPNPCASSEATPSSDTTVRVEYRNASTNACTDGSDWADYSYNAGGSSSGWSP